MLRSRLRCRAHRPALLVLPASRQVPRVRQTIRMACSRLVLSSSCLSPMARAGCAACRTGSAASRSVACRHPWLRECQRQIGRSLLSCEQSLVQPPCRPVEHTADRRGRHAPVSPLCRTIAARVRLLYAEGARTGGSLHTITRAGGCLCLAQPLSGNTSFLVKVRFTQKRQLL